MRGIPPFCVSAAVDFALVLGIVQFDFVRLCCDWDVEVPALAGFLQDNLYGGILAMCRRHRIMQCDPRACSYFL